MELVVKLLSPLCAGSGTGRAGVVDREVIFDPDTGLPQIPGRRLKGLLRDAYAQLRSAGGLNDAGLPPAEAGRVVEILVEVGRVAEQLLRDAADVHAGAAEALVLRDRDARAERSRHAARAHAARAGADREEVVVELRHGDSLLPFERSLR